MSMNNFEIDKIFCAIIVALVVVLLSDNIGNTLYAHKRFAMQFERGYKVEVEEQSSTSGKEAAIPAEIDIAAIFQNFNVSQGEMVFKKCAVCHTTEKNGANKVGPNLWNILNAKVASREGFAYSNAMLAIGQSGAHWGYEELYRYLYSPKKYVPGTKMAFAGLKKDLDRVNLIMYLRTFSDNQVAPPTQAN